VSVMIREWEGSCGKGPYPNPNPDPNPYLNLNPKPNPNPNSGARKNVHIICPHLTKCNKKGTPTLPTLITPDPVMKNVHLSHTYHIPQQSKI